MPPSTPNAGQGISFTLGAGVGVAPDYEGSDDYEVVPLWNLSVVNLYHPKTFVQVFGPRLRSNFIPNDHWRLGLAGQFIKERDDVENNQVDDLEEVDASLMLGVIGGYDLPRRSTAGSGAGNRGPAGLANDNGFLGTLRGLLRRSVDLRAGASNAFLGSTWASEDYMSAYFGIDADDAARSGLGQFNADEGFKTSASAARSPTGSSNGGA